MTERKRIREWLDVPGRLEPGEMNSITDIPGVEVGHCTIREEGRLNTGVTVIKPHPGNVYLRRVPAAVFAGNGHTKTLGVLQVDELGELESYIALTNTLSVGPVAQGLIDHHKKEMEGMSFRSINVFVGETNDGFLSDILGCHVRPEHVAAAIKNAGRTVVEGAVGAGTGCMCFGFKGGIGTSSRVVRAAHIGEQRDYTVGVLAQANFGGNLNIYGVNLPFKPVEMIETGPRGSCMLVVATDAPMSDRQLGRLARRAIVGQTLCGTPMTNASGDVAVAFSAYEPNLRDVSVKRARTVTLLSDDQLNPFFEAAMDAAREAIYNALTMSPDTHGYNQSFYPGFDITQLRHSLPLK